MGIIEKLGKMGVPGFRSGKKWKMAVAVFGYFWILMISSAFLSGLICPSPVEHEAKDEIAPSPAQTPTITQAASTPVVTTSTATPIPTTTPFTPIILSGRGQTATDLFYLPQGLVRFEMTHDGESNFAVQLLDDQGRYKSLLANEIGTFQGSKAERIDRAGMFLLNIDADGIWKVTIK